MLFIKFLYVKGFVIKSFQICDNFVFLFVHNHVDVKYKGCDVGFIFQTEPDLQFFPENTRTAMKKRNYLLLEDISFGGR